MSSCNPEPERPPRFVVPVGCAHTYIPDFGPLPLGDLWGVGVRGNSFPLNQFISKSLIEAARQIMKDRPPPAPEEPK